MSVKKQLIKLGTTNPELRPHIRPILASLNTKVASDAMYQSAREIVFKARNTIETKLNRLIADAEKKLKRHDLKVDVRASYLNYRIHGSDGLLVGGIIKIVDMADIPRDTMQIEEAIIASGLADGAYVTKGTNAGEWLYHIGDSDRV